MMQSSKYRLSFTAASLMVPEMVILAQACVNDSLSLSDLTPDLLKKNRSQTGKREFMELVLRLKELSSDELNLLAQASADDQKLICLLAFGRTYPFFRDFMTEVVAEKVALFDNHLTERDYNAYFNRKTIEHDELEAITESTKYKIKQVTFKVLQQAGIIDNIKNRNIQIPAPSRALEAAIAANNPNDLMILLQPSNYIFK